jgi:hypothetical protein
MPYLVAMKRIKVVIGEPEFSFVNKTDISLSNSDIISDPSLCFTNVYCWDKVCPEKGFIEYDAKEFRWQVNSHQVSHLDRKNHLLLLDYQCPSLHLGE